MHSFLAGGGGTGARIRALDWPSGTLGNPAGWSQSLKTLVAVMLAAKQPMFIAWGPERTLLYNDPYALILGRKHPAALGQPFLDVWAEVRTELSPLLNRVFVDGEPVHMDDITLTLDRGGQPEEAHFAFSYTPVRDEQGGIAGLFCACTETTDQILAERRRKSETERQRRLFEQAPGFITILSSPGHVFEFVNQSYVRLFGGRDFVGRTVRDVFPELEGQGFFERLDQVYVSGERFVAHDVSARLRRSPDAAPDERFLDFIYEPVTDDAGAVTGIFCEGYDVTETHLAQKALRESEEFNRRVLASSEDCIKVLDLDAKLIFMSEGGRRVMDVSDFNAIRGCPWLEFYQGQSRLDATAAIEAAKAGRSERFQGPANTMAGRPGYWDVQITPIFGADGQPERILAVSRDITATRRAEDALRKLNETLEQQVEDRTRERDRAWKNSRDLQVVTDSSGIFQAANEAWTAILGWRPDEVVGRHHLEFVHPDDRSSSDEALATALVDGLPIYENRARHKDGSYRWIAWVAAPEDGVVYASGRHVTAEKEAAAALAATQEQLRQAQKMEAVGQLTGGVAHDFNNLLTVIKSSTDLLKRPDLPEERRQRYVGAISDTVARAAKLTGQLLSFARRQALKPEVFDVGRSVLSVADMVGTLAGSRIRIVTNLAEVACYIDADPSQFDTAIVNMAVNARDAMDGEGVLTISVAAESRVPEMRSHPARSGSFVAVSISDTGTGIAPDDLERIFEPFFTTKGVGQGTGLGLSQVFGFAKQSGGEIGVESTLGVGTTFTLYLPQAAHAGIAKKVAEDVEPPTEGHGMRVLVVEDNMDVGVFATQTLAELGYSTVWATNAEEALAELAKDASRFDVVFTDVVMPGMNGIDLAHQIRRRYHDMPVLLASGYSHVLAKNGTYGFELLNKPYSVERLSRVLHKVAIRRRRKRSPGT